MIFTSFEFAIFFGIVMLVRSCLRSFTAEKWFLLVASYLFYMSWSIPCGLLILATSLIDYCVGIGLGRIENERRRRLLLITSIAANLGVLGFFKYTNFVVGNAWSILHAFGLEMQQPRYDIILPAGISFFTFQSMTYTIETYRRNLRPCHSPRDFLLFVSFFPQLLAGPINRAADLLPQFAQRVRASAQDLESGLAQFALGAVKKLVISDQVAPHVDLVFSAPGNYDGFTLLLGSVGYGLQIYCDFSGYSDMAIGCARMMGFRFLENFQMPYSASNITEFWRRWHISLSSWFRDYVYIPLGGSREGPWRTYANLSLTMLLCGLWHGASWNFVLWGGLHGAALGIHRVWRQNNAVGMLKGRWAFDSFWSVFSRLLTLFVVLVGWILFRAQSCKLAGVYLSRMLTWSPQGVRLMSAYILAAFAAVFTTHLLVNKDRNWALDTPHYPVPVRLGAYSALAILLSQFAATGGMPFIYFQF